MLNSRHDYDDERTELIWKTVVRFILIPVGIAVIVSILKIFSIW